MCFGRAESSWYAISYKGKGMILGVLVLLVCILYTLNFNPCVNASSPPEAMNMGTERQNQETEDQSASEDEDASRHLHQGRPPLGRKPIPEMRSSFCSRLFFLWINPLFGVSRAKALEKSDIWLTPDYNRAGRVTTEIQNLYLKYEVLVLAY